MYTVTTPTTIYAHRDAMIKRGKRIALIAKVKRSIPSFYELAFGGMLGIFIVAYFVS